MIAAPHLVFTLALLATPTPTARIDLDGDGRVDCVDAAWEGGSGFGGLRFELRPGCGPDAVTGGAFSALSEHLHATTYDGPAPTRALHAGLRAHLATRAALRCRTPREDCPAIDGSFAWLLDEIATRPRAREAPHAWRRYAPRWEPGSAPALPTAQVIDVGPDALSVVWELDAGELGRGRLVLDALVARALSPSRGLGWIAYPAHTHGSLTRRAGCARWALHTTAHAVAVVDRPRARWSWAYVSTAGDKLRHPAIIDATCGADGVVRVIRRDGEAAPESIVVDPERGLWRVIPD